MSEICLIRHGETAWNLEKRVQGHEDIPLDQTGEEQARRCGLALAEYGWNPRSRIASSPLSRAYRTAEIIAGCLQSQSPILRVPELIERDYGTASGTLKDCPGRRIHYEGLPFSRVESWDSLQQRMLHAICKLCEQGKGDLLTVSHGAAISALLDLLSGGALDPATHVLKNTSISFLRYDAGTLTILRADLKVPELVSDRGTST